MKLLIDSQLPAALARHVTGLGTACAHVRDVGLESATDLQIWEYAESHDMTIVSKDSDFSALAGAKGIPPQVIWIRLGNCRRTRLLAEFERRWSATRDLLLAGTAVVELR